MSQYYIGKDNKRLGPFPLEQLLANGLTPDTLVWCSGMPGWQRACEVPEVAALFAPQSPQYQQPDYQPQGYQQPQYQQQYQQPAYQQPQYGSNQFNGERPQVSFGDAIKICFSKYVDFTGRARRSEFWWFSLFTLLVSIVTCGIGYLVCLLPSLAVAVRRLHDTSRSGWWLVGQILLSVSINAASMMMGDSLNYYDYNHNLEGGTLAIIGIMALASFIFSIILLVFYCTDSDRDENQYGPSPKYQ